jgi:hypothetical protein
MKKVFISGMIVLFTAFTVFAEEPKGALEWSFTGELGLAPSVLDGNPAIYDTINTTAFYNYGFFSLLGDVYLKNDKKYSPAEDYWFGHYFYPAQGGAFFDFDLLSLQVGRFYQKDVIESPYSLFFSSMELPALFTDMTFQTGRFTYTSRWVLLNTRSSEKPGYPDGYPDRGMNYKIFAFRFGDLTVGLQDVVLYVDYVFDPEYFFSPVPHTIIQLHKKQGKPWSEYTNDNIIMGLFAEWHKPKYYLYGQWLLDDINLDFLVPAFLRDLWGIPQIPQKTAWSLGGTYDFSFGRLGFYHAGATKYAFSPDSVYEEYPYQYTYYPAMWYELKDGTQLPLDYRDNYIGYMYGENNLAFLVDFTKEFGSMTLNADLEYVISGSKSPANPWHGYDSLAAAGRKTRLLDDPVLEHTATAAITASWSLGKLTLVTKLKLGGVFNKLELKVPDDLGPDIFQPDPGNHQLLYQLMAAITYTFGSSGTEERVRE